jgi:predicted DsbA family dithiol-disulfide isomerase
MITVEVWSDVVCPWCYIGKRRFETALRGFDGDEVEVVWRSFQLDPSAPAHEERGLVASLVERRMGTPAQVRAMFDQVTKIAAEEGLAYDFDKAQSGNTFDAHRLLQHAKKHGVQGELKEHLMDAYFTRGARIGDRGTLVELAAEVGLDGAPGLDGDAYAREVREDIDLAREIGITGVPFFVFDRAFAVSGAQPVDVFTQALRTAHEQAPDRPDQATDQPEVEVPSARTAPGCDEDSCAV